MDPLSNLPPIGPVKDHSSIAGRAIAAFGSEMDQLLAATLQNKVPSPTLGNYIDTKA